MTADAASLVSALRASLSQANPDLEPLEAWIRSLLGRRARFGITRVGSLTRLDRIGVPIVQVVRPASLSNAVSQGKGSDWAGAAASGLMESLESWAAESIPPERLTIASVAETGREAHELYAPWVVEGAAAGWADVPLPWIDGWDLLHASPARVPSSLVDTDYTLPSPHPAIFPRVSTGLGAGRTFAQAIVHAALEVLERHTLATAVKSSWFYETQQTRLPDWLSPAAKGLVRSISDAGFHYATWVATGDGGLPVYHCHVMEDGPPHEMLPLPSEGSGCGFTHEEALMKALLEACQARAAALSGAREDITRLHYPDAFDRPRLAEWRALIDRDRPCLFPTEELPARPSLEWRLERAVAALAEAGARRVFAVPLFSDAETGVHVVRLVCPPLVHYRGA